jgi:hypothetical protein
MEDCKICIIKKSNLEEKKTRWLRMLGGFHYGYYHQIVWYHLYVLHMREVAGVVLALVQTLLLVDLL